MELNKNMIGKSFFFYEATEAGAIVYFGNLISILPKYMFMDKFSSKYSREQTYLFDVSIADKSIKKSVSSSDFIFDSLDAVLNDKNKKFFDISVIMLLRGDSNEYKV